MCQRSDQTWNLYWKMRGKRLAEEAATERFSTWPWATHQTDLKRVLFIIVVWLSTDPRLSVILVCCLLHPSSATCPVCDLFIQHIFSRKGIGKHWNPQQGFRSHSPIAVEWRHGLRWSHSAVNKQKTSPDTFLHICSVSLRIQKLLTCLRYYKRRQTWATESYMKYDILSGHFPQIKSVQTGGKMLADQEGPISPPLCSSINSYAICRSKAHQSQGVCFGIIQEAITFCKYWDDL